MRIGTPLRPYQGHRVCNAVLGVVDVVWRLIYDRSEFVEIV